MPIAAVKQGFTFYLPQDDVAAKAIMDDLKFELNRDIGVFLSNAAERQCFSGGEGLLEPAFIDQIAINDVCKCELGHSNGLVSTFLDTFNLLGKECESPFRLSLIELVDDAMIKALAGNSVCGGRATKATTLINLRGSKYNEYGLINGLIENCVNAVQRECIEWEVQVVERMLVQLSAAENRIEQEYAECDECLQKCNRSKLSLDVESVSPIIRKMRIDTNVSTQVEKLARDVRMLENIIGVAENKLTYARVMHELCLQQKSLKRKALQLVRSQEKCFTTSDLVPFEPQVLSWNKVELLYPNVFDDTSTCVGWSLSERAAKSSVNEVNSCDSNSEASERVWGIPSVTSVPPEFSFESSTLTSHLLRSLFSRTSDDHNSSLLLTLMDIVGLFQEKCQSDLSNSVLTASEVLGRIKMLEYDIIETEKEFHCKVNILPPAEGERMVGVHVPLDFGGRCHVSMRFWYDPGDYGNLVRLLPSSFDLDVDIGETFTYVDQLSECVKHMLRERVKSNCNVLALRTACRSIYELMGIS